MLATLRLDSKTKSLFCSQTLNVAEPSAPAAVLQPAVVQTSHAAPAGALPAPHKAMEELDMLGKTLLQQSLPPESQQVKW